MSQSSLEYLTGKQPLFFLAQIISIAFKEAIANYDFKQKLPTEKALKKGLRTLKYNPRQGLSHLRFPKK